MALFVGMRGYLLYAGISGIQELCLWHGIERHTNHVSRMFEGVDRWMGKMTILGSGVTSGVTERGYIFSREGLQKWVFRGCDTRGATYHFFKDGSLFCSDSPPLNATNF